MKIIWKGGIGYYVGNKNKYFMGNWENGKFYGLGLHIYESMYKLV